MFWKSFTLPCLILALIVASCAASSRNKEVDMPDQPILFQQSFINHAWGYQNRGWIIDGKGVMRAYRVTSGGQWRQAAQAGPDSGCISRPDLESNVMVAEKVIYEVPPKELGAKTGLIAQAAKGAISERTRRAYDAGSVTFSAYHWDEAKGMYREILLNLSGDWRQENLDPAAVLLLDWLKGLNQIYADSLQSER